MIAAAGLVLLFAGEQRIAAVRGLAQRAPLAAVPLLAGGLAITGMPPSAIFISELLILRAGLIRGHYLVVGILALLIIVGFAAIMQHVTRMSFGGSGRSTRSGWAPHTCLTALAITALPLILLGIYLPDRLAALFQLAGAAIGP